MIPVVLQLVHIVFINAINMMSTFWSEIKNKKNNIKSNKSSWLDSAVYEQSQLGCPHSRHV